VALSVTQEVRTTPDGVRREIVQPAQRRRQVGFGTVGLVAGDLLVALAVLAPVGLDLAVIFGMVAVALTAGSGGYRVSFRGRVAEQLPALAARVAVATVISTAVVGASREPISWRAAAIVLGCLLARIFVAALVRRVRLRESGNATTLVVGAGAIAQDLADRMRDHPELGLQVVGLVDDVDEDLPFPVLGGISDLPAVLERHSVQVLIVAFGASRESEIVPVLRACERRDVDVYVVPRLFELGVASPVDDELWGIPLRRVRRATLGPIAWRTKRLFDVVVASAMIVLLAPVMAFLALAVRLSSEGPVFYRQERIGHWGRPFHVLKFRSMRVNDDGPSTWDVTSDARVTRVGRIMRATSLDELPQLLNVLRGDMSLVGPRPERPRFVEEFSASVPRYADRHRVPVGITGLAQVNGLRGDTSINERAQFDNLYIEHWSLWGDIIILARTLLAVVRPPVSVLVRVVAEAPVAIDLRDQALSAVSPARDRQSG
jgi:exopolysaccharide biosynthesis polyprenyl glycosylphosphotransferase